MTATAIRHLPVMVDETLNFLFGTDVFGAGRRAVSMRTAPPAGVVIDATVGTGGHASRILERFAEWPSERRKDAFLIGIDQDPEALAVAREALSAYPGKFVLIHGNFRNLAELLAGADLPKSQNGSSEKPAYRDVTGILMDLGLSSLQVGTPDRGFSFIDKGPLDMRMNPNTYRTARQFVLKSSEEALTDLFQRFGEERFARRIARRIVEARDRGAPFETTTELAELIAAAVPRKFWQPGKHPATRCFQALRIAVNQELEALQDGLMQARGLLAPGGRIVVISYHSLEDRMVKHAFQEWQKAGAGFVLKPFPAVPKEEEVEANRRARSAKLRGFAMAGPRKEAAA